MISRSVIEEKDKIIEKLRNERYLKVLAGLSHIELVEGRARFISQSEVQVDGEIYGSPKFVIATGSSAILPPIRGIDEIDYLTNIEALALKKLPESMVILGGGALGIEFAQMYSRFGTKVCLLQRRDRIVPREEPELAKLLQSYFQEEGIEIYTGAKIESVEESGEKKIVNAAIGGKIKTVKGEQLLIATGRRPNTSSLGLESCGVSLGKNSEVIVDDEMQAAANVWAAGDVTGEPMLETVAAREGMIAAHNALLGGKTKIDYRVVPHAVSPILSLLAWG